MKFKLLNYPKMTCPFKVRPFIGMNAKEARAYCDWFAGEMGNRIQILKGFYHETDGQGELDNTCESLTRLWEWTRGIVSLSPLTPHQLRELKKSSLNFIQIAREKGALVTDYHVKEVDRQSFGHGSLSEGSGVLCVDLGFYLTQMLIRRFPKLEWKVYRSRNSRDLYFNHPVLYFGLNKNDYIVPHQSVKSRVARSLCSQENLNVLAELYLMWVDRIEGRPLILEDEQ